MRCVKCRGKKTDVRLHQGGGVVARHGPLTPGSDSSKLPCANYVERATTLYLCNTSFHEAAYRGI